MQTEDFFLLEDSEGSIIFIGGTERKKHFLLEDAKERNIVIGGSERKKFVY